MYDPKKVEDFFKARKFKQGLAYVENFLRKEPNNPEYLNDYGLFFSYVYGFEWGQKYLHRALEQQKDYYPAILNLVEFYLKNNLPFSAIKVLENACIEQYQDLQEKLTRLRSTYQPALVSFYIPVYNVEKYIEMCIQNVLRQTYPICELLIIDDASPDNSMSIVHKYQKKYPNLIKIITHSTNKGLAAVRNTALAHARGEFLATVDTDAIPEETFLEKIMMEFNRHSDKLAGICGKLLELNSITVTDRWREVHMKQHWGDKVCEPAFLYGSTSVFRKEALKKVGGFREDLRNNGEDMDISAKLKQHNYQLLYLPQAKAYHLRKDSLKSVVNTFYNWVMPSYVDGLDNFTQLLQKTVNCLNLLLTRLQEDIKFKRYHLFYPTFLSILAWPLKDIKHSALDEEVKVQTMQGLASFLLYLVRQNPAISKELVDFLSADLAEMLSLSNLNQLKDISKSATTPTRQIKELFPKAHLEFILKVSEQLKNVFNFEPLIYKMLEVCRRRIAYEESWQPKYDFPKVLLANPPWRDGKRYGIRAGSRWPFTVEVPQENWTIPPQYVPFPFFLAYTTSLLKEKGFNAVMLDAIAEGLLDEEFFTRIQGYAPDLLLIETATASIYNDIDYVRKLKTLLPKTKIILTGTHVTHFKQKFLEEYPCVDGIIIGEYEEAMLNIVNYFKEKGSFNGIEQKGFLFFDPKGEIQGSAVKTDLVDIDALPYPERLTLPIYNYEDLFAGMVFPSLQIHASRGCPYGCIYCVWPQVLYNSSRYRTRDPIKVVDEIEKMIQDYGYRSFYFDDDTFNIGKQRILTLCAEIKKRGLNKIPWSVMARADTSDFETLKAMQDAGLNSIKFGVESGVQELVDACGKGLDLKKVEQAVQWCKQLGLQFHLTFTFGLPGETKETIEKTIQYAMKLAPDTCQFSLTTPFPGTKHFELAKNKGLLLTQNWDRYDGNRYTVMRGENLSQEELEQAVKEAYRRWEEFDRKRKCKDCAQDRCDQQESHPTQYKSNINQVKVIFICKDGYELAPARIRCYNFAQQLGKQGIDTQVLSFYDYFRPSQLDDQLLPDIYKLDLNVKAYYMLKQEKNAIFYVQKIGYYFLAPYLLAEENNNKIILDYDDFDLLCYPFRTIGDFVSGMHPEKLFEDLCKKSAACVGASKFLWEMMRTHNPNSYYIVTGVDTEKFNFPEKQKQVKDLVEIIWLGDIWSPSILKTLIDCIKLYASLDQPVLTQSRLNLIVFGEFATHLQDWTKNTYPHLYNQKIVFHPKQHPDQIPAILSRMHIGLVPLDTQDDFSQIFNKCKSPTKMFEYMASKVAVLGTKWGEIESIIQDGQNGFLFSDSQEFLAKLKLLIVNHQLRNQLTQQAYADVFNNYSLNAIGPQLLKVIESII